MPLASPNPQKVRPKRGRTFLVALVLLCGMLMAAMAVEAQNKDWRTFQRTSKQQGVASGDELKTPLKVAWTRTLGDDITASPLVSDGTVIVATQKGRVFAFDTVTAERLWMYDAKERIEGTPAIENDQVFVATYNETSTTTTSGKLIVLSLKTGIAQKVVTLPAGSWGGPTVDSGRLFLGLENGKLRAYATEGMFQSWEFDTVLTDNATNYPARPIRVNPSVEDNVVYFGAFNKLFFAVNANNGKEEWIENLQANTIYSSGAIDPLYKSGNVDGTVYVGGYDGTMYAFETQKEPTLGNCQFARDTHPKNHYCPDITVFKYQAGAAIHSSPAIANGYIYFGDNNGVFHAVSQKLSGTKAKVDAAWTFDVPSGEAIRSSPAVIGKLIVVGSYDGKLYVFKQNAEGKLASFSTVTLSDKIHASPAIAEGRVWVASQDGVLYSLVGADEDPPDPVPEDIAGTLPDLAFNGDVLLTPRKMAEGQPIEFRVDVINQGAIASGPFTLRFYGVGDDPQEATMSLAAGANATHSFSLLSAPANLDARFVIDEQGQVAEGDEANNELTLHLVAGQDAATGGENGGAPIVIEEPLEEPEADPDEDVPGPGIWLITVVTGLIALAGHRLRPRA